MDLSHCFCVGFLSIALWEINRLRKINTKTQEELKQFHGRLCSLEARWHKKPLEDEKINLIKKGEN